MKKKRMLSCILMICLLLSTICSSPVFAAEGDSKGLEQAIVMAKKIITVPNDYSDFTHSSTEVEMNGSKATVWSLSWSEKGGKNGVISASVDEKGNLYEYNKYSDYEDAAGLTQITKEEAQKSAEEFLGKAITIDAGQMKRIDKDSTSFQSESYDFTYGKFINDIPVNFNNASIGINKYTGEVISFSELNADSNKLDYPSVEGTIEQAIAEKAYIEKVGIDLKYYSYYDYQQKKMNIFAGYSVNDNKYKAVNGKTGEVIDISNEDKIYNPNSIRGMGDKAVSSNNNAELTKEESDAINNVSGLISKEKAEDVIRQSSEDIITSEMKLDNASLNKNDLSQKYVWDIGFENGYGQVDAKSEELLSAHFYDNDSKGNKDISKLEGRNIAEDFLKKVAPNKFAQTKYEEREEPVFKINIVQGGNISYFNFVRQVNGVEFVDNSLRVEIDNTTGKVIGYDNNWYDNVIFPDVSKVMNKDVAFNKFKEFKGFGLQYNIIDKTKVGLVYNFKNLDENYIIDPTSGIRLEYTGKVYKDNKLPEYTDISGHWSEKTVKELLENGYYIDGEKFNPDMNITQINFFEYIYSSTKNNYTDDEFYDMLVQNGIIKKEEKAPSSFVSNQDAAKFITRYLGYSKVAEHPEIFTNPFKDTIEEQYKGYAATCYALGIIKGDSNGKFNGTHNISNAESAVIVYNLVKNNTH